MPSGLNFDQCRWVVRENCRGGGGLTIGAGWIRLCYCGCLPGAVERMLTCGLSLSYECLDFQWLILSLLQKYIDLEFLAAFSSYYLLKLLSLGFFDRTDGTSWRRSLWVDCAQEQLHLVPICLVSDRLVDKAHSRSLTWAWHWFLRSHQWRLIWQISKDIGFDGRPFWLFGLLISWCLLCFVLDYSNLILLNSKLTLKTNYLWGYY